MFSLGGKVALVTGSTRGIGWAIAQALAEQGAHVVVNGRTSTDVDVRVAELVAGGGAASASSFDVADIDAAVAAVDAIAAAHGGRIDIVVNNAGIQHRAPLAEFEQADFDRVLRTNLAAPFAVCRAAAAHMAAAGWGRIVNITSVNATDARPTIPAYIAAKSGLAGLTRALAVELAATGITVNAIAPGYVATEMNQALIARADFNEMIVGRTPARRWGDPAEIAAAAAFLVSDEASYVTGHVLAVDGGMSAAL